MINKQEGGRRYAAARLLARLASVAVIPPAERDQLLCEMQSLMPTDVLHFHEKKRPFVLGVEQVPRFEESESLRGKPLLSKPQVAQHRRIESWALEAKEPEESRRRLLVKILAEIYPRAHHSINEFLDRKSTTLVVMPTVRLDADGRTVHEKMSPDQGPAGADLWLYDLLRESPARFGRCRCGTVFAHPQGGGDDGSVLRRVRRNGFRRQRIAPATSETTDGGAG